MGDTAWRDRIGERVAVLRRTPEGGLGEVVGELTGVDTHLRVRTRSGPVDVPLGAIVTGKVVPPPPSRRGPAHLVTSITDLEVTAARHWRPERQERHGGWLLRAGGGFTGRANSVLPAGAPPGDDVPAALRHAVGWYAAQGLPAKVSVASAVPQGVPDDGGPAGAVGALCEASGWHVVEGGSALVMTAPAAALAGPVPPPDGLALDLAATPDEQWLAAYRYRGQDLSPHALPLLLSAPEQAFFSVREAGATVAVARGSLGGGWAGLTAVEVTPSYRRRGLAGVLLAAVAGWGLRGGARSMFLQVSDHNEPAIRLYLGAGFAVHHRYDYWQSPPS